MNSLTESLSNLSFLSTTNTKTPCISCDMNESTLKAPCGHYYCKECIRKMCSLGLTDRTLVPARCCKQNFTQEWISDCLTSTQYTLYKHYQLRITGTAHRDLDPTYEKEILLLGCKLCPQCGAGI